jgi:hypothetical protein
MILTPSGKTRVMVAQNFSSPLSEGYGSSPDVEKEKATAPLSTEKAMDEDVGIPSETQDVPPSLPDQPSPTSPSSSSPVSPEKKKKTLSNYVFEKLESYGYPGRRLQEFKAKFVRESVTPEGIKDIQIEIPDKKYPDQTGVSDTIENDDLKEMAGEINKMFGLNFNGAERSDGKWTIKFTSQKLSSPDEEGKMIRDNLDEVYGTPSGNKAKPGRGKVAFVPSLHEMIDSQKDQVVSQLIKQGV